MPHSLGETGVPFLDFALATMECEVVARHDGGDHVIVLGRVLRLKLSEAAEPLVFFRSRYRQLDPHSAWSGQRRLVQARPCAIVFYKRANSQPLADQADRSSANA